MNTVSFPAKEVLSFYERLQKQNLTICLDGGWGVDALLGYQSRAHNDLDIIIQQKDVSKLETIFVDLGYKHIKRDDTSSWNYLLRNSAGLEIDVHVIKINESGDGIYGPIDNGVAYPKEALKGIGHIDGKPVKCLTADYQLVSHTGYPLKEKDYQDVFALSDTFNLPLPDPYNEEIIRQLIAWAAYELKPEKCLSNKVVVKTPWSFVIKIQSQSRQYYLKRTPKDLYIEADLIHTIQTLYPSAKIPTVISKKDEMHCFLMPSCGDKSLRTRFNGKIDQSLWFSGIQSYVSVQRNLENNIDAFLSLGLPDWRLCGLAHTYQNLVEDSDLLIKEGFTACEMNALKQHLPEVQSLCKEIACFDIKETLVNVDFNENNMIYDDTSKQINILDWGESVISHPFFSIASHLFCTSRRYNLSLHDMPMLHIQKKWLSLWEDVADPKVIDKVYNKIVKLLPVFAALGLYRLQKATHNQSKKHQRWFIKDILKDQLN